MSTSSDSQVSQQWWIRSASNGDVFGPVPVSELADWARQSRVFPEDAVSTDRRSWRTARTVPELGMDTVIATPDGRIHGPLHAAAAATLAEKGKLPEGAKVFSASQLLDMGASEPPSAREDPKARLGFFLISFQTPRCSPACHGFLLYTRNQSNPFMISWALFSASRTV